MADLNEPKKETVRISLPPQSTPPPALPVEQQSPRIILPNRPPVRPAETEAPIADLRPPSPAPVRPPPPLARPPASPPSAGNAPLAPAPPNPLFSPITSPAENRVTTPTGFRKETARVTDSPMKATVRLGTVQPAGVAASQVVRTGPPAVANPPPQGLVESVPTQLCWALLAISAFTLLIQLWTYFS